ncbi:hypothetical protein [Streptomyces afghaniensis]|uniref:hypothetical protein n=1 Tax=Streptomyces afghaniensis TaxID=66865 RepID=UPI0027876D7A|nr:hypothetical protein [Streptomyces afghaniensis]MDQ1016661.1 hypothetical protein [Streptomyces afghaniensis]
MNDSFGNKVQPGDYALSVSTSGVQVKMGRIVQGAHQLMIEVDHLAVWGEAKEPRNRRTILGTTVIVLKKADGTIPYPMGELYD